MSEAAITNAPRRNRNTHETAAQETSHVVAYVAPTPTGTRTLSFVDMDNLEVEIANRWCAGMVMEERDAEAETAFVSRQFMNNMNANAKARAKRVAEAKAADKAPDPADAPYTVEEVQTAWLTYFPNVGGVDREASEAKRQASATWKAWVKIVGAHNADVEAGGQGTLAKAPGSTVGLVGTKGGARDQFIAAMQASGRYDAEIKAEYDQLVAEIGSKPSADKVVLSAADVF